MSNNPRDKLQDFENFVEDCKKLFHVYLIHIGSGGNRNSKSIDEYIEFFTKPKTVENPFNLGTLGEDEVRRILKASELGCYVKIENNIVTPSRECVIVGLMSDDDKKFAKTLFEQFKTVENIK